MDGGEKGGWGRWEARMYVVFNAVGVWPSAIGATGRSYTSLSAS